MFMKQTNKAYTKVSMLMNFNNTTQYFTHPYSKVHCSLMLHMALTIKVFTFSF